MYASCLCGVVVCVVVVGVKCLFYVCVGCVVLLLVCFCLRFVCLVVVCVCSVFECVRCVCLGSWFILSGVLCPCVVLLLLLFSCVCACCCCVVCMFVVFLCVMYGSFLLSLLCVWSICFFVCDVMCVRCV